VVAAPTSDTGPAGRVDFQTAVALVAQHKAYMLGSKCELNNAKSHGQAFFQCLARDDVEPAQIRRAVIKAMELIDSTKQSAQVKLASRSGLAFKVRTSRIAPQTDCAESVAYCAVGRNILQIPLQLTWGCCAGNRRSGCPEDRCCDRAGSLEDGAAATASNHQAVITCRICTAFGCTSARQAGHRCTKASSAAAECALVA
jgi:hypothetical protein